jgi:hypothetical protein
MHLAQLEHRTDDSKLDQHNPCHRSIEASHQRLHFPQLQVSTLTTLPWCSVGGALVYQPQMPYVASEEIKIP